MKVLVVHPPTLRLKNGGACEQDRLQGAADLVRMGHEVTLLTQLPAYQDESTARAYYHDLGVRSVLVGKQRQRFAPARLSNRGYLDGAAWEVGAPIVQQALHTEIQTRHYDVMWCHASYSWSPAITARKYGLPAVIRSVNYEPLHHRMEAASGWKTLVRTLGKTWGEQQAVRAAAVFAAITPHEQAIYRQITRRIAPKLSIEVLPLRKLPSLLADRPVVRADQADRPLKTFFMGSTYNVPHNRAALDFIVDRIAPRLHEAVPGAFEIHLIGGKIPVDLADRIAATPNLIIDGFVDDLNVHLADMDIALVPSMFGAGMQQKVFEPICRGFPTVTSERALAGYPFVPGTDVLTAVDPDSFVQALLTLRDLQRRQSLAECGLAKAHTLFGQSQMDSQVTAILEKAISRDQYSIFGVG